MGILQILDDDLKEAMREKNALRLNAVRGLKTALKNRRVLKMADLTEEEIIQVVSSQVKQRKESIEAYTNAGRPDLADKEQAEMAFLQKYMPQMLSEEETDRLIADVIEKLGAKGPADLGKVMKAVMAEGSGRIDGKLVNQKAKAKLGGTS